MADVAGSSMVDNGWWSVVVPHDPAALSPDGNWYRYHLVSEWTESGDCTGLCDDQQNNFKVSVQGTPFLLAGSTIGFQAFGPAPRPDTWDPPHHGPTTYQGWIRFLFRVEDEDTKVIDLYDGDADRADGGNPWVVPPIPGTQPPAAPDDPNSPAPEPAGPGCIPPPGTTQCWLPNCGDPNGVCPGNPPDYTYAFPPFQTSIETVVEGVNAGSPPDDSPHALFRREPGVYATVAPYPFDPVVHTGWPVTNDNPSGDKEWEMFRVGLEGETLDPLPDVTVPAIPAGYYAWQFEGLDTQNTLFIHSTFDTYGPPATIGNTVWWDDDEDGFWDGNPLGSAEEPGIPGVLVNLYDDTDMDGEIENGQLPMQSQLTDSNGQFLFMETDIDLFTTSSRWMARTGTPGKPLREP